MAGSSLTVKPTMEPDVTPTDLQEQIWRWAGHRSQEIFRLDLELLGEKTAEAIERPSLQKIPCA